jgi:hypothetical protein
VLTFRKNAFLRHGNEDLGDSVKSQQHQRFERGQSIAEVDKSRDENEKVQHEGANIAERHGGGRRNWLWDGILVRVLIAKHRRGGPNS